MKKIFKKKLATVMASVLIFTLTPVNLALAASEDKNPVDVGEIANVVESYRGIGARTVGVAFIEATPETVHYGEETTVTVSFNANATTPEIVEISVTNGATILIDRMEDIQYTVNNKPASFELISVDGSTMTLRANEILKNKIGSFMFNVKAPSDADSFVINAKAGLAVAVPVEVSVISEN